MIGRGNSIYHISYLIGMQLVAKERQGMIELPERLNDSTEELRSILARVNPDGTIAQTIYKELELRDKENSMTLDEIAARNRILREVKEMINYYRANPAQPLPTEFYQLVERGY